MAQRRTSQEVKVLQPMIRDQSPAGLRSNHVSQ